MKCAKILPADGLRKPQPYPGDMARIFNIRSDAKDWCSSPHRIAQFRCYIPAEPAIQCFPKPAIANGRFDLKVRRKKTLAFALILAGLCLRVSAVSAGAFPHRQFQSAADFAAWRGEGIEAGGPGPGGLQVRGGAEFRLFSPPGLGIPAAGKPYLRIRLRPFSPRYLRVFWLDGAGRPVLVPKLVQPPRDRQLHTFWIPLAQNAEHRGTLESLGLFFGGSPGWVEIESVEIRPLSLSTYLRDQGREFLLQRPLNLATINGLTSPRLFGVNLAYYLNLAAAMVILGGGIWFLRIRPPRRRVVIGGTVGCLLCLWIFSDLRETLEQFRQVGQLYSEFVSPPPGEKTLPDLGDFYSFVDFCRERIPAGAVFALVPYPNWPFDVRIKNLLYPARMADCATRKYLEGEYPRYLVVYRQPDYAFDPVSSRLIYRPEGRMVSGSGMVLDRYSPHSFIFREESP